MRILGNNGESKLYQYIDVRFLYMWVHQHARANETHIQDDQNKNKKAGADPGAGGPMDTEATHVTRVLNRRRMITMIVGGPHRRGASRGPDDHGGGRSTWERSIKKNATFLEKEKSELTTKERS